MDEEKYIEELVSRFEFGQLTIEDKKNWKINNHSPKEKMNTPIVHKNDYDEWDVEVFSETTNFYTVKRKK